MSAQLAIPALVVAFIVLFIGIMLAVSANRDRKTFEEARLRLGDGGQGRAPQRPLPAPTGRARQGSPSPSTLGRSQRSATSLPGRLKTPSKSSTSRAPRPPILASERDELRTKVNDLSSQVKQASLGQAGLVDLRLELADALGRVEQLKSQLAQKPAAPAGGDAAA